MASQWISYHHCRSHSIVLLALVIHFLKRLDWRLANLVARDAAYEFVNLDI
jgi:hypothetical protein